LSRCGLRRCGCGAGNDQGRREEGVQESHTGFKVKSWGGRVASRRGIGYGVQSLVSRVSGVGYRI
jgi:hypothetical protein